MAERRSVFWDDLEADLQDAGFRREYLLESLRVQTIDSIVNALDEARVGLGWSKAKLARAIDAEPAVVRRLFSAKGNPTLSTLAEIAGAVGLRISVEPLPKAEADLLVGGAPLGLKAFRERRKSESEKAVVPLQPKVARTGVAAPAARTRAGRAAGGPKSAVATGGAKRAAAKRSGPKPTGTARKQR